MPFQPDPDRILWRLHLAAPPERVFSVIDSDDGRAGFWAESAVESDGQVTFRFSSGIEFRGRILDRVPGEHWTVEYFGSVASFELRSDGAGGTDLTLVDTGVPRADRAEVTAGWLNVLLPLKAWVDHGIDLRNHDPARSWDQGYVDQ
ncbi:MAG TPA: SRPBCC domain-containing protein [Acidimicrobiia bacterium]|nr:SRPBCC domain-containing protein [Acidimicrobiia bacterium]